MRTSAPRGYDEEGITFVNDIPMCTLSLVPPHHCVDMVSQNLNKRRIVEVAIRYPARQLRIPSQCVASQLLIILSRPVCDLHIQSIMFQGFMIQPVTDLISTAEAEGSSARLGCIPFHRIFWSHRADFRFVLDDVLLRTITPYCQGRANISTLG